MIIKLLVNIIKQAGFQFANLMLAFKKCPLR